MRALSVMLVFVCFIGITPGSAQWDQYPSFQGYLDLMAKFQTDYPALCKIIELGTSVQGKKLVVAKISDNVDKEEKEPAFLYHAVIHGDEVLGYMLTLRLIDYLLVNYGKDTLVTKLVDGIEIWIDPLVNPDGAYKGGDSSVSGAVRFNANNFDLNRNWPCWCMSENHTFGLYDSFELEVKSLKSVIESRNFVLSADIHAGSQSILYPSKVMFKPDKPWFLYVCRMYADIANDYASGYILNVMEHDSGNLYETHGAWTHYTFIYRHCRNISLELSFNKILNPALLSNYWNFNYMALLTYMEQTLFGIQGTVTDSITGQALEAKVFVDNHDKDSSIVYSRLPYGDFYRPIFKGVYSVTFSAKGYRSKTIPDIKVENNAATVLDVKLSCIPNGIAHTVKIAPEITVVNCNGSVKISFTGNSNIKVQAVIFDLSGRLIKDLNQEAGMGNQIIMWDRMDNVGKPVSNGCYFICVNYGAEVFTKQFILAR